MNSILPREMDRPRGKHGGTPQTGSSSSMPQRSATASETSLPRKSMDATANSNTRSNFKTSASMPNTIRTVTPEPTENGSHDVAGTSITQGTRGYGTTSPQSSPRSIPGGEQRRRGIVFNDVFGGGGSNSYDSSSSSPPPQQAQHPSRPSRPRTKTMDGAFANRQATSADKRHRIGSFSSSSSQPFNEADVRPPAPIQEAGRYTSTPPAKSPDLRLSVPPSKDEKSKKTTNRRLTKRGSRPTSPVIAPPPTVDSLPLPIPTSDANKVLLLMKTLCGRMRGEIEYQSDANSPWYSGICYIEEEKGSLMFDPGQNGPFHIPLASDLRGCRVFPYDHPEKGKSCLELVNHHIGIVLLIRPLVAEECDLWLAALLCWQQMRPSIVQPPTSKANNPPAIPRSEARRRGSTVTGATGASSATIIKVGKVMLWDKGVATSPRAIVKRPSTRDLRTVTTSFRRVSCILQDNGEFKLMTENDVTVLSVIELSQLSRSAIQQLDKSVLDEDYCIAILPIYSPTATQLSIFRPVYIALDTRVLFEVWFVLLRAFAVPDIYGIEPSKQQVVEVTDLESEFPGEMFRVEKTIHVRVTEAKIKRESTGTDIYPDRHSRNDQDPLKGNYLAEVILDGEIRARTTTKPDTKNPFWREDVEFTELPASLPFLSVVLKRIDGDLNSFSHQLQASLGLPKSGNLTEVLCGSVDIPLDKLDKAKDHEQWFPIIDDKRQLVGNMLLKVRHEEVVVLLSKEYQPISELLHRFSVGLTAHLADIMPSHLRRLAEIFLNIFQVSGSSGEWLMALVEDEIDGIGNQATMKRLRFGRRLKSNESITSASDREAAVRDMSKSLAGEANLLFRGNTLLTQALEFHMRRLGKEFLEEILSEKIFEINESNPDCEVDPGRAQNEDDIPQHWSQLIQLTTEVWECISSSANRIPPELRQILKYIRAVAEDRYGDFLRTVTYTSVSGFVFLRFICPAILNPKLFGILRDHPRPRAQRTLTLIAKGLQALANLSTFGKKESWMENMNKFLGSHRQPFKDFIDQICSIPTERTSYTLPASYSTPITILGRLSPNSREGFPSLPYLVDHARNFSALVNLWVENHPPNAPPTHEFEGDLAEFNKLCIKLHDRFEQCLSRVEELRNAAAEEAAQYADEITESMERASINESIAISYGNSSMWIDHDPYKAPGSSGSDADTVERPAKSAREGGSLRQMSEGSDDHHRQRSIFSSHGTLRIKGSSKQTRNFLSNLIGKKTKSSERINSVSSSSPSVHKEKNKSRDRLFKEKDPDREKESTKSDRGIDRGIDRARGVIGNLTETWGTDSKGSNHTQL